MVNTGSCTARIRASGWRAGTEDGWVRSRVTCVCNFHGVYRITADSGAGAKTSARVWAIVYGGDFAAPDILPCGGMNIGRVTADVSTRSTKYFGTNLRSPTHSCYMFSIPNCKPGYLIH